MIHDDANILASDFFPSPDSSNTALAIGLDPALPEQDDRMTCAKTFKSGEKEKHVNVDAMEHEVSCQMTIA